MPCRRCHGRARIPDPTVARKAGAAKSYVQIQAERLAAGAGERLADFSERLRQDYGVPLPPSARWAPGASVPEADTIPCPDCVDGTVACDCRNGKRVCDVCHGTSAAPCTACGGTGKVIQYRQIVRRFDTHVAHRTLPLNDAEVASWVRPEMIRRASGEDVWQSDRDALGDEAPEGVPAEVWQAVHEFAAHRHEHVHENGRHVIGRVMRVTRIPVTHVEYGFAAKPFAFVSVGRRGEERFWADAFPPRWSRVGRFFRALTRDLQRESRSITPEVPQQNGSVSSIEEYRQRRVLGPANTEERRGGVLTRTRGIRGNMRGRAACARSLLTIREDAVTCSHPSRGGASRDRRGSRIGGTGTTATGSALPTGLPGPNRTCGRRRGPKSTPKATAYHSILARARKTGNRVSHSSSAGDLAFIPRAKARGPQPVSLLEAERHEDRGGAMKRITARTTPTITGISTTQVARSMGRRWAEAVARMAR